MGQFKNPSTGAMVNTANPAPMRANGSSASTSSLPMPMLQKIAVSCPTDAKGYGLNNNSGICYTAAYSYGYLLGAQCGGGIFNFNCDIWAEADGAANIQYAATASDTVMALLSVGINCDLDCFFGAIDLYIHGQGSHIVDYFLTQPKRSFMTHGPGSYAVHSLVEICGAEPALFSTRIPYQIAQSADGYPAPWDSSTKFRLGTYGQTPGDFYTRTESPNLYPWPSSFVLGSNLSDLNSAGIPKWSYDFSGGINGWNFDIMFGGADNANAANLSCYLDANYLLPGVSGRAYGSEHWAYHGEESPYGRGLPVVDLIFSFYAGHLPYGVQVQ